MYQRSLNLDVIRGLAISSMAMFHFFYYLSNFSGWRFSYDDPKVYLSRLIVMTLFLGCVGFGLALQAKRGYKWQSFLFRTGKLGVGALTISIATYLIVPDHWIYFGILQFLFISTFIAIPFSFLPKTSLFVGCTIILGHFFVSGQLTPQISQQLIEQYSIQNLPFYFSLQFLFDFLQPLLNLPNSTFDITYFIPWFGLILIGIFIGHSNIKVANLPNIKVFRILSWMGQRSLPLYFIHAIILVPIALTIEWMINGHQSTLVTSIQNMF
ncbi:MAG: DUF1624 domain-containing protein [Saccharospirillaceae bacterium]|nr:DUF1624 domain-containing protein [Pseudomonadales bacterium]NRB79073.1 DUF1624 domain-containing protein [Saccharospirillaceae bacterium]